MRPLPEWFCGDRWVPPPGSVEGTRVWRFMQQHGFDDYQAFLDHAAADPGWFYPAVFDDLDLPWPVPFERVLDTSEGPEWARWFVGGRTNLAWLAVDRWRTPEHGHRTALSWEGENGETRTVSYEDLGREVEEVAAGLRALGVGHGDVVALYAPLVVEAVVAMFAAARIGAILAPAFSGYGADALAERLQLGRAKVLVTADGFLRRGEVVDMKAVADDAAERTSTVRHVVVIPRLGGRAPLRPGRDVAWEELRSHGRDRELEWFPPETPCLLAFTSGSTGRPKGAIHCHGRFPYRLPVEMAYGFDMGQGDVSYWPSDMGWIMGPMGVAGALLLGAAYMLLETVPAYPAPDRLWQVAERHGITHLGVAPTLVRLLAAAGERWVEPYDLDRVRVLGSTGEPMTVPAWRWLHRHVGRGTRPIINLTGGTEVGCAFLIGSPIVPVAECRFAGASPGIAVDAVDGRGEPVVGELGELVVTAPWPAMTWGFWDEPERYVETYWSRWPGWWQHGDRVIRFPDGSWLLPGRSDDLLKIAGKRVGPAEFESAASSVEGVASAAAVGVPHPIKGEVAVIVVQPVPDHDGDADLLVGAVTRRIEEAMGKAMRPGAVLLADELPLTRSGKVHRRAIRGWLAGEDPGDLSNLDNPGAEDAITAAGAALRRDARADKEAEQR